MAYYSVSQRTTAYHGTLQRVTAHYSVSQRTTACHGTLQRVTTHYGVLWHTTACHGSLGTEAGEAADKPARGRHDHFRGGPETHPRGAAHCLAAVRYLQGGV